MSIVSIHTYWLDIAGEQLEVARVLRRSAGGQILAELIPVCRLTATQRASAGHPSPALQTPQLAVSASAETPAP
jgi:hypothetical protein